MAMKALAAKKVTQAWFGLHDNAYEGNWAYLDGTMSTFKNFKRGEPNNGGRRRGRGRWNRGADEDCAAIGKDGKWNDMSCDNESVPLCSYDTKKEVPKPLPRKLEAGAATFFVGSRPGNFRRSQKVCEREGGELASILSQAELDAALDVMLDHGKGRYYIGLNDKSSEGTFEWADGSEVDFTNWNRGEPNNWGRREDCTLVMPRHQGLWNDVHCRQRKFPLCQKRAGAAGAKGAKGATEKKAEFKVY